MAAQLAWVRHRSRSMGLGPGAGVVMEASPAYAQGFTHLVTAMLLGGPLGLLDPRDHRLALATLAEPAFQCWRGSRHLVDAVSNCGLTGPAIVPPVCVVSIPIAPALFDAFLERFGVPLRQLTGAPVLPLLHHLAGRRHVMTIHPRLPALPSDRSMGLAVWRDSLTRLLEDYVRRFPEQCPHLALAQRWTARPSATRRREAMNYPVNEAPRW